MYKKYRKRNLRNKDECSESSVRQFLKKDLEKQIHEMDEPDCEVVQYHSMNDWVKYTGEFDKFAMIPMEERTYRGKCYHPNYEKWYYSFPLSEEFRLP